MEAEFKDARKNIGGNVGKISDKINGMQGTAIKLHLLFQSISARFTTLKNPISPVVEARSNFEAVIDKVQAVSGATAKEMSLLSESAERLGSKTRYSASQVGELQVELQNLVLNRMK